MKTRVKSAIVLIAITLLFVLLHPISRMIYFAVAGILCCYEYSRGVEKLDAFCCAWVMYTYIAVQAILLLLGSGPVVFIACFAFAVYLALFSGVINAKVTGKGTLYTLAGVAYPAFLFSLLMIISMKDNWHQTFLLGTGCCVVCDTFALLGGKRFGRRKVAPHISPNKTVEGCLCGALSSIPSGVLCWLITGLFAPVSLPVCLITAFLASSMGQVGDLAESLMKRMIGIKDFSNLIPGHGGVFDRADSLLFSIPTAYLCLLVAEKLGI